ncbi:hypothetical protein LCGC14_2475680, partial [marine sediment metagenome]
MGIDVIRNIQTLSGPVRKTITFTGSIGEPGRNA